MKKYILLLMLFAVGCGDSKSNNLYNPPLTTESVSQNGGTIEYEITPKAEILFVLDNSKSMVQHISNVSQKINQFVDAFTKDNPFDYNLAVVSVYDSRRYSSEKYKARFDGLSKFSLGQFRPVKSSATDVVKDKSFISSSDENLKAKLTNTLNVEIVDLDGKTIGLDGKPIADKELVAGGPEVEESFSPVAKVFGLLGKKPTDPQFLLGPKAYKIIFFVTDAADNSPRISASELYYSLVAQAGGNSDRVMAFGAIIGPNDASDACKADPGIRSKKIEEFLSLTQKAGEESNIISLCDKNADMGKVFENFGKSIKKRASAKVIQLKDHIPVISDNPNETLRVFYGTQAIPMETKPGIVGFKYSPPPANSIYLNPDLELTPQPGAKLRIEYVAVHPSNIRNGRVIRYGTK